jgi:hypothetical protein
MPFISPAVDVTTLAALLDVQVPPATALPSNVTETGCPIHSSAYPVFAAGAAFTETVAELAHPVGSTYEMVVVPVVIPITKPVVLPTVALTALLLLHVPPAGVAASVVALVAQILVVPVIAAGRLFTVTILVAVQPVSV